MIPMTNRSRGASLLPWSRTPIGFILSLGIAILFLSNESRTGSFATPAVKAVIMSGVLVLLCFTLLLRRTTSKSQERSLEQYRISRTIIIGLYVVVVILTSMMAGISSERVPALAQFIAVTAALILYDSLYPGGAFGVMYLVALMHVALALLSEERVPWRDGSERLSGGTHPILLGFEASILIVVTASLLLNRPRYWKSDFVQSIVIVVSLYVLYAAGSRQSWVSAPLGVFLVIILAPGRFRVTRWASILASALLVLANVPMTFWIELLGETENSIGGLTGRTYIWRVLWGERPSLWSPGYGFASLSTPNSSDSDLYFILGGEPAESGFLQTLTNSGWIGVAAWILVVVTGLVAMLKAAASYRMMVWAILPILTIDVLLSSGTSGNGLQWLWLVAVLLVPSDHVSKRLNSARRKSYLQPRISSKS